jgi:hypothetical protein
MNGLVNASYDVSSGEWSLTKYEDQGGYPYVALQHGTATVSGENLTVTFNIFFHDNIPDLLRNSIWMWCNDTDGVETDWEEKRPEYFNIYNQGGLILSKIFNPMAVHKVVAGSAWDWRVGPDLYQEAYVQLNATFRNLQHARWITSLYLHSNPLNEEVSKGTGYAEYTFYACSQDHGIWSKQFGLRMNITDWELAWGASSMEFQVEWYDKAGLVTSSTIYGFFEIVAGTTELNLTRYVVDLWLDLKNSSTVLGGRVNPLYYDRTNWWGAGTGGSYLSFFEETLTDYDNVTMSGMDVKLWRIVAKVYKNDVGDGQTYHMTQDTQFNILNEAPQGIDAPMWIQPQTPPAVTFIGFLSALGYHLGKIASNIVKPAIMGAWNIFAGFLDTMFTWAGWKNGFSTIAGWIANGLSFVTSGVGWGFTLLTSLLTMLVLAVPVFVANVATFFTGLLGIFSAFGTVLGLSGSLGDTLGYFSQLIVALLPLAGLAIVMWILSAKNIQESVERAKMVFGVITGTIHFFIRIGEFIVNLIFSLIHTVRG